MSVINPVVLIDDDSSKDYVLNDEIARDKILKGTLKNSITKEVKNKCVYFSFSTGAFYEIVIKTITFLKSNELGIMNRCMLKWKIELISLEKLWKQ